MKIPEYLGLNFTKERGWGEGMYWLLFYFNLNAFWKENLLLLRAIHFDRVGFIM